MNKIFGVGWAKTGTKTLGLCLKTLGFNHQSTRLDLVQELAEGDLTKILKLAKRKDSFEDWPWALLYKELNEAFPGSKFILTYRNPESWLKSYLNMLANEGKSNHRINRLRSFIYQLPFPNVSGEDLKLRYLRHNKDIIAYFSNNPDSLLLVNWEDGDGWRELCGFLGLPVPNKPFPHSNRGIYSKYSIKFYFKKIRRIFRV